MRSKIVYLSTVTSIVFLLFNSVNFSIAQDQSVKDFVTNLGRKLISPSNVEVIFESPQTLILNMVELEPAGEAIDFAKQKGYHIDSVTFTPNEYTYNIFMSK